MRGMRSEFPLLTELVLSGLIEAPPAEVKLIESQQASDRYWLDDQDIMDWDKEFGPLSPPYSQMWIEATARQPSGLPVKGKISGEHFEQRVGAQVTFSDVDEVRDGLIARGRVPHPDTRWVCIISVYTDRIHYGKTGHNAPGWATYEIGPTGRMLHASTAIMNHVHKDRVDEAREAVSIYAKSALFAIGLMNCRNVGLEARMTAVKKPSKKSTRKRPPSVEYHVIKLPQPKVASGGGSVTGSQRQHTARGHFKTYTDAAPLMGRHVGTYYWGWQVRGSKANGEVVSSYQVGV